VEESKTQFSPASSSSAGSVTPVAAAAVSHNKFARVLLYVDVQLPFDENDRIAVREGDNILQLAEAFTLKHNLDFSYTNVLENMLKQQLEQHITTKNKAATTT
jgi:hypothetical protein